jgi:hypothetical protein
MTSVRLCCLACSLLLCGTLLAQTSASISGSVNDPSGAAVTDAHVTVTDLDTGAVRSGSTNTTGFYTIPGLAPGNYLVDVGKDGFRTAEFKGVPLTVAQTLVLNARLALGVVSESVQVSGDAEAAIDTETSQLSTLVNAKTMTDLPLLTRNPYELVLLSPGTIQTNDGNNGFAVNGSRDRNNNFLLDGVDNNDTSVPGGGAGILGANPDSTQEFRVITNNFNAEYGRNTGAIINVITRGGTNQFHGDAYWFGRYNALGARDFFNQGPGPQNPYVRNDFGFSVGGPIKKNRTFFFINNEYQRFRTSLTDSRVVPTAAFKSGVFTVPTATGTQTVNLTAGAADNMTGLGLDPQIQKLLNLLPNPNGGDVIPGVTGILNFASPDALNDYNWTGKIDHKLSEKHQLSLRYAYGRSVESNQGHLELGPGLDLLSTPSYQHGVFAGLTSTFSNRLINDFKFGWNKNYAAFNSNCNLFNPITGTDGLGNGVDIQVPDGAFLNGPVNVFGCNTLFDSAGQARNTGTTSFGDAVTWVKSNHTIKFGGDFRDVRSTGDDNFNSRSLLFFNRFSGTGFQDAAVSGLDPTIASNVASTVQDLSWFLVGGVFGQFQSQFYNHAGTRVATDTKTFRQHEYDGFIQDTWKLATNLTLNYGFRYQFNGIPFETGGNFSNLFQNPDSVAASYTFTLVGPGTGHQVYSNDYKDFEPRFGIAWDPFKDGKTSVRAGYGIFHDRIFDNLFGNARSNPPFQGTFLNVPSTVLTPEQIPAPATQPPPGTTFTNGANQVVTLLDPNIRQPASQNWNFGIQRTLPGGTLVELDYVGSRATHVIRLLDAVPPDPALIKQNIASCVAQGGCLPGDPQGVISGSALYGGINNPGTLVIPPSIRETALQTAANFPTSSITRTNADSRYNALQATVNKQLSHGLQIGGAYTWSHATDDSNDPLTPEAGTGSFPVDSRNPNTVSRGNSDNDIRHRGVVDFSYELPFGTGKSFLSHGVLGKGLEGIQISGIVSAQTGHPYTVFTSAFDNGRTGIASFSYPDVIGNPFQSSGPQIGASGVRTGASNVAAFSNTFLGHIGDSGRNQFYGPHYPNADVVLMKNVRINERFRMQLRSEFFNLLNHPQFQQPGNIVEQTNTFGLSSQTITRPDATTSARQIQLALKMLF